MRAIVFVPRGDLVDGKFRTALLSRRWDIASAAREEELVALVRGLHPELVVLPTGDESTTLEAARRVRAADRQVAIVLSVSSCSSDLVIAAMRCGVNDVVTQRSTDSEIGDVLNRVALPQAQPTRTRPLLSSDRLVGRSKALDGLRNSIQRVAATDSNVLITGETGTGKELTAELIHSNSRRRDRPFVCLNCAAIPDGLLESELFGYERGAFTGAHAAREGKLQYAHGGTLFLDEVGDMNVYAQAKILRAIESRKVQRLGANREIALNVRIIAATNQNLEQMTSQHRFRQDLFFRLNVARIVLPPLREHAEDIPDLVEHVFAELGARFERSMQTVDATYLQPLMHYDWPGNVRELRNVIESTLVFCNSNHVTGCDLPPYVRALFANEEKKRDSEREKIVSALQAAGWNRNAAAQALGCSRMTLYRKMVRYELFDLENDDGSCNVNARA
jgi:DNA-binding NtrC family response regulator